MIGVCRERSRWRMNFAVSNPSMPGICTSSRMTAKSWASSFFSASGPGVRLHQLAADAAEDRLQRQQVLRPVVDHEDVGRRGLGVRR